MSTRLPLSFNRARVLEGIALIVFASLVIAFVHRVVPYLDPMIAGPEGGPSSDMQRYED